MARVGIFGAGGYLGIPLCRNLQAAGHDVTAFDRFYFGRGRISGIATNMVIADTRSVTPDLLQDLDAVVDLAGLSNDASAEIDPDLTKSINLNGAVNLASAAERAGVRRYVYSSSASVYGHGGKQGLTETDAPNPQSLYALLKLKVEEYVASTKMETVILRNATVFGLSPRMRFDLAVNIMVLRAWRDRVIYVMGGGEQWRPFIHVNDAVKAFQMAVELPLESVGTGQVHNVGGDYLNFQIGKVAEMVRDQIPNVAIHRIPDDPDKRSYHLSFEKWRMATGFVPMTDIASGIADIREALAKGVVSGDDPTAFTLSWYRGLIEWEARIRDLSVNGRVLEMA